MIKSIYFETDDGCRRYYKGLYTYGWLSEAAVGEFAKNVGLYGQIMSKNPGIGRF